MMKSMLINNAFFTFLQSIKLLHNFILLSVTLCLVPHAEVHVGSLMCDKSLCYIPLLCLLCLPSLSLYSKSHMLAYMLGRQWFISINVSMSLRSFLHCHSHWVIWCRHFFLHGLEAGWSPRKHWKQSPSRTASVAAPVWWEKYLNLCSKTEGKHYNNNYYSSCLYRA